jgi:hypothetical protein
LGIDKRVAPLIIIIILIPFTFLANKFILQNYNLKNNNN